jgi:hypothetical protein
MECLTDSAPLELLWRANACFRLFFDQFSDPRQSGTDEELRALRQLHEVMESVRSLLDGRLQSSTDREVREALGCYRENLVRLRRELASRQEAAMARRASLDSRREHLHATRAWCAASRAID